MNTITRNTALNVKTIDIQAKEWFDKVNGNSYFASLITVNYGMPDTIEFKLPFQYGYDSAYLYQSIALLKRENIISVDNTADLLEQGIILRSNIQRNCKQRDLKNL